MHQWISLTTALEAEGNWIVTLTVHDHTQTQPIPISEWRGRGGGGVWVVFEWVGGDERELVMFFLYCAYLVSSFVYGIVLDVCLFDFDFSGDYVIELFGKWIATHRLSKCKSPHHDHRGIRFLRWKDNWFWSHHLQWNISCTLWVPWIHRMGWITASVIWNHGLQREARIEDADVCFNGCEWECVWISGLLIIWNGNKEWVLMGRRGMCHDGILIANRWYDDDINAWWYWILWWMMLIWLDDCI